MKKKIVVIDNVSGKKIEKEIKIRNHMHFEVQLKNRAHTFKDRTKYTRKKKHKERLV